jgi:hypothetical protein
MHSLGGFWETQWVRMCVTCRRAYRICIDIDTISFEPRAIRGNGYACAPQQDTRPSKLCGKATVNKNLVAHVSIIG